MTSRRYVAILDCILTFNMGNQKADWKFWDVWFGLIHIALHCKMIWLRSFVGELWMSVGLGLSLRAGQFPAGILFSFSCLEGQHLASCILRVKYEKKLKGIIIQSANTCFISLFWYGSPALSTAWHPPVQIASVSPLQGRNLQCIVGLGGSRLFQKSLHCLLGTDCA